MSLQEDLSSSKQIEVEFRSPGPLGLQFGKDLTIESFYTLSDGRKGAGEKCGLLRIGDKLIKINKEDLGSVSSRDAFSLLDDAAREHEEKGTPRTFTFQRGNGTDDARQLSEFAQKVSDGALEHLDVYCARHMGCDEEVFHVMLSQEIGTVPKMCKKRELVFVDPREACDVDLKTPYKKLNNSIAIVHR